MPFVWWIGWGLSIVGAIVTYRASKMLSQSSIDPLRFVDETGYGSRDMGNGHEMLLKQKADYKTGMDGLHNGVILIVIGLLLSAIDMLYVSLIDP